MKMPIRLLACVLAALTCLCMFSFACAQSTETTKWVIDQYVDDFGDPIGEEYGKTLSTGTFTNSIGASGELSAITFLENGSFAVRLVENGSYRATYTSGSKIVLKFKVGDTIYSHNLWPNNPPSGDIVINDQYENQGDLGRMPETLAELNQMMEDRSYDRSAFQQMMHFLSSGTDLRCVLYIDDSKYSFNIGAEGFGNDICPMMYRRAEKTLADGDHMWAASQFRALGDWRDAPQRTDACLEIEYRLAEELIAAQDYAGAKKRFQTLGNWRDAAERMAESDALRAKKESYDFGLQCIEQNNYDRAYQVLSGVGDFMDAPQKAAEVLELIHQRDYAAAQELMDQRAFAKAAEAFRALGDYADAAEKAAECDDIPLREAYAAAQALMDAGDYEQAIQSFGSLNDYADAAEKAAACAELILRRDYDAAQALLDAGAYVEAAAAFQALGEYSDAPQKQAAAIESRYQSAMTLLEAERFDEAAAIFRDMGDYKEAAAMVPECAYRQAAKTLAAGEYDAAAAQFAALGDYRDAAQQVDAIHTEQANRKAYAAAQALMDQEAYAEAAEAFGKLGDYSDAAAKAADCTERVNRAAYDAAQALMDQRAFDEAAAAFSALGDYADAAEKAAECIDIPLREAYDAAQALMDSGDYAKARSAFAKLKDYSDAAEKAAECAELELREAYAEAQALLDAGDYEGAAMAYGMLGDQEKREEVIEARYQWAMTLLETERFDEAAAIFKAMTGYKEAAAMVPECAYRKAAKALADGRYDEAAEQFAGMGDYRDAATQVTECRYQKALSLKDSAPLTTVDLLSQIRDYRDAAQQIDLLFTALGEAAEANGQYMKAFMYYSRTGDLMRAYACRYNNTVYDRIAGVGGGIIALDKNGNAQASCKYEVKDAKTGKTQTKSFDFKNWKKIIAVAGCENNAAGLCSDGTVKTAGAAANIDTKSWTRIVAVGCTKSGVVGLRDDGTVVTAGDVAHAGVISSWTNVSSILVTSDAVLAVTRDGRVLIDEEKKWLPVSDWDHALALFGSYDVIGCGREDGSTLFVGNSITGREIAQKHAGEWTDLAYFSYSYDAMICVGNDGSIKGNGGYTNMKESLFAGSIADMDKWTDLETVLCTREFVLGVKKNGTLVGFGRTEWKNAVKLKGIVPLRLADNASVFAFK